MHWNTGKSKMTLVTKQNSTHTIKTCETCLDFLTTKWTVWLRRKSVLSKVI